MDLGLPARFIIAFVVVLALIMLTAWLIRRFSGSRVLQGSWARGREHRVEVIDATVVDAKRRLVLVRRDHVEHLVMIGGTNDFVVENNIAPPPDVAAIRAAAHQESVEKAVAKKTPEAKIEAPQTAAPAPQAAARTIPQPQPRPATPAAKPAPTRAPSQTTAPAAQRTAPQAPARPTTAPSPEPAKTPSSEPAFDDMAKRLEAALKPLEAPSPPQAAPAPQPKPASPSTDKSTDSQD